MLMRSFASFSWASLVDRRSFKISSSRVSWAACCLRYSTSFAIPSALEDRISMSFLTPVRMTCVRLSSPLWCSSSERASSLSRRRREFSCLSMASWRRWWALSAGVSSSSFTDLAGDSLVRRLGVTGCELAVCSCSSWCLMRSMSAECRAASESLASLRVFNISRACQSCLWLALSCPRISSSSADLAFTSVVRAATRLSSACSRLLTLEPPVWPSREALCSSCSVRSCKSFSSWAIRLVSCRTSVAVLPRPVACTRWSEDSSSLALACSLSKPVVTSSSCFLRNAAPPALSPPLAFNAS
mmetsp:Transcript_30247/g.85486  ORF Transcript_30247/g.85486 Transcript_30247/m.85486 type:complete len:300 (+) Transcript_30247:1912-2811(+)